jgi:4-alpha-glucanotransferase
VSPATERAALERLARHLGIEPAYVDQSGRRREVGTETLLALFGALGVDCDRPAAAPAALQAARARDREQRLGGVLVAWDGVLPERALGAGAFDIVREGTDAPIRRTARRRVPLGIHELRLSDESERALLISAPSHAAPPPAVRAARPFGVIAPTYALVDRRRRSAGDLTSLSTLGDLAAAHGARLVGTLPLLADFATADDGSVGQAPYSPVSRMWWNEAYLDLSRLPEAELDSAASEATRPREYADLAGRASAMRPMLDAALQRLESRDSPRRRAFRRFVTERPTLLTYARFRAAVELYGTDRKRWPSILDETRLATAMQRHAYAQWATDTQIAEVAEHLAGRRAGLYLDLPVGCRPDGFDPYCYPTSFVPGVSIGAPPDVFFSGGQDWGFAPPHPEGDRAAHYAMWRGCLEAHMSHADALRLDHVMGLSRLWWVPSGMDATAGAYVRYPLEELLALVCLYSHRHRTFVIGEDLGTVEPSLERNLSRRALAGMSVLTLEADHDPERALAVPPSRAAYVTTHDTATFAGWLDGDDLTLAHSLGVIDGPSARRAEAARPRIVGALLQALGVPSQRGAHEDARELYRLVLERLGASNAALVLVALEDLWGARDQQNLPGAGPAYPSFLRRFDHSLEEIALDPQFAEALDRLAATRRRKTRRTSIRRRLPVAR